MTLAPTPPTTLRRHLFGGRLLLLVAALVVCADAVALAADARLALLIANSKYPRLGQLGNPPRDIVLVADALRQIGFEVMVEENLDQVSFRSVVRDLARRSRQYDTTLVYYAGHGAQIEGVNYLLPVDLPAPEQLEDIKLVSLTADEVLASIKSPFRVLVLDACRDNPVVSRGLSKGRGAGFTRGLAPVSPGVVSTGGVFIAYSTQANDIALDGEGQYSPFAAAFAAHVSRPVSIDDMFAMVTREVLEKTRGFQRPFKYASLDSILCLTGRCGQTIVGPPGRYETPGLPADPRPVSSLWQGLAALPKASVQRQSILDTLRQRVFSRYGSIVIYGTSNADQDPPLTAFGFDTDSVVFAGDEIRLSLAQGRHSETPEVAWEAIRWDSSLFCSARRIVTNAVRKGDEIIYVDKNQREKGTIQVVEGTVNDSLLNILCPGPVSIIPIPREGEVEWIPAGNVGRVPNDTISVASGMYLRDEQQGNLRYAVIRFNRFVNRSGEVVPNARAFGIIALDCDNKRYVALAELAEVEGRIVQIHANPLPWQNPKPGFAIANVAILACEASLK